LPQIYTDLTDYFVLLYLPWFFAFISSLCILPQPGHPCADLIELTIKIPGLWVIWVAAEYPSVSKAELWKQRGGAPVMDVEDGVAIRKGAGHRDYTQFPAYGPFPPASGALLRKP